MKKKQKRKKKKKSEKPCYGCKKLLEKKNLNYVVTRTDQVIKICTWCLEDYVDKLGIHKVLKSCDPEFDKDFVPKEPYNFK